MLNISKNSIAGRVRLDSFSSYGRIKTYKFSKVVARILTIIFPVILIFMFLPWTQNIRSKGYVTTVLPEQRPQTIQAIIPGRIEEWHVREGDRVNKGDTIVFISEVKSEYFDPELLLRTENQLKAKKLALTSYGNKISALENQIQALKRTQDLKIQQANNYLRQAELKVESDSIDFEVAKTNFTIAQRQLNRTQELYNEGLKSLTEVEDKNVKFQLSQAKLISAENKLLTSKNALINAQVELTSIDAQYRDKLAKTESDRFATMSGMYDAEAVLLKLENEYTNYAVRSAMYYIRAPQDGFITKTIKAGIGETIKEGEELVSIMPADYQLAVEMYVDPVDLPLIHQGQKVRIMFDGWPAIVFSGWPNTSSGTYGGKVFAVDNFISSNGKYRVLVAHDPEEPEWPDPLRVGSGAVSMALLTNVPVWYEIWRKLNGFPPNFYTPENNGTNDEIKNKAPLKSVK